ncbi:hypothetical protein [Sphingosinithalassobacter portus]|uniref:hypothetical protein n=1 Tax=Stakelama portus TaxID=2676234 RepID=UPI000D6DF6DE|nr:hypothetical protein [Sphingosinithalassobacter portus]
MDRRNLSLFAVFALIVTVIAVTPRPHADIRLLTHESSDLAPHKLQAAVDLGVIVVDFLYTWTSRALTH